MNIEKIESECLAVFRDTNYRYLEIWRKNNIITFRVFEKGKYTKFQFPIFSAKDIINILKNLKEKRGF